MRIYQEQSLSFKREINGVSKIEKYIRFIKNAFILKNIKSFIILAFYLYICQTWKNYEHIVYILNDLKIFVFIFYLSYDFRKNTFNFLSNHLLNLKECIVLSHRNCFNYILSFTKILQASST